MSSRSLRHDHRLRLPGVSRPKRGKGRPGDVPRRALRRAAVKVRNKGHFGCGLMHTRGANPIAFQTFGEVVNSERAGLARIAQESGLC